MLVNISLIPILAMDYTGSTIYLNKILLLKIFKKNILLFFPGIVLVKQFWCNQRIKFFYNILYFIKCRFTV